jgi:hypothetical protein
MRRVRVASELSMRQKGPNEDEVSGLDGLNDWMELGLDWLRGARRGS